MQLHKDHRLNPLASGRVHCLLCDAVAWLDELETCAAPQSERDAFDARYTPAAACEPVAAPRRRLFEVTVRERMDTVRSTQIEAHSEEEAREIAESEDWRTWESVSEDGGDCAIEKIEEVKP